MAGRHSQKSSKAPIAVISIAAVIIIVGVVCAIMFFSGKGKTPDTEPSTASDTQITAEQQTTAPTENKKETQATANEETTSPEATTDSKPVETQKVVVPTKNGGNVSYFNASYMPYKAIDTSTNNECSLREVFGSAERGALTFNSDGTFTDGVNGSKIVSGAYAVEGETISATYTNDKNMSVRVTSWDENTPSEMIINYGGYDVYFKML